MTLLGGTQLLDLGNPNQETVVELGEVCLSLSFFLSFLFSYLLRAWMVDGVLFIVGFLSFDLYVLSLPLITTVVLVRVILFFSCSFVFSATGNRFYNYYILSQGRTRHITIVLHILVVTVRQYARRLRY